MSTTVKAPVTAPASTTVVTTPEPARSNLIGLIALGLAIIGFIMAALLYTAGLAWILLIPALILGVVGLILPFRRKGSALAAVIIALIAFILALVGFRLPLSSTGAEPLNGALNNAGVNPFSVLTAGLPGQNGQPGAAGAGGTNGDALAVSVGSVDCHQPLASVTGLNITGQVCAVKVAVTNNGTSAVDINSSSVLAGAGGQTFTANANLGKNALSAHVGAGQSTIGTVYVNLPSGAGNIDSLTVRTGQAPDTTVSVDVNK